MTTEYEAFYTCTDGLRLHAAVAAEPDAVNDRHVLAIEEELNNGVAYGMLFDSEQQAREFCAQQWPMMTLPLTVRPDSMNP